MVQLKSKPTCKLKFTGSCDRAEFKARCSEHAFWYHSFYFDNGFAQRGDYDIARDIDTYGFPEDMTGMTVLDVGTGSGWFATYFEQQGADVTTVDARGYCDFDVFGRVPAYPDIASEKAQPDRILPDGRPVYYSPVSKGFWIMKDLLGLRAEYVNARVYDLCPELFGGKQFDLVFMGAVLMHLRDPIGALMAARSVCKHRLMASSYVARKSIPQKLKSALASIAPMARNRFGGSPPGEIDKPYMWMNENAGDGISWWEPNRPCLLQWFKGAGFAKIDADQTINLTTDKLYFDEKGNSSGMDQILVLVNAFV